MLISQETIRQLWDEQFKIYGKNKITYDDWLSEFDDLIAAATSPIIDLGCGFGNNTLWLCERGKKVFACDYSVEALKIVNKQIPAAQTLRFDLSKGLPFPDNSAEIIVADLSLHYFDEKTTLFILGEIKRVLKSGGSLLFRVNSVKDVNHGALQNQELEHHLFFTQEMIKRFFDREDLNFYFKGWKIVLLREEEMTRYQKPKIVWVGAVCK